MTLAQPTAAGQSGVWLLELASGYTLRLATRPTTADGYAWRGGLGDVAVSTAQASIALTVAGVDWTTLRAHGLDTGAMRGRLWLWHDGQTLEEAWLVREGPIESADVGDPGDVATLSLGVEPWEDLVVLPPATATVDESTWPVRSSPAAYVLPESVTGSPYPLVVGQPGTVATVAAGARVLSPASPAYLVEYWGTLPVSSWLASRLLIAGHPVAASSVRVVDVSSGTSEVRSVSTTTDRAGRSVAYVDWTGSTLSHPDDEHEYWISWDQGGGGIVGEDGTTVRGLGSLLVELMVADPFRVDVRPRVPFDVGAQRGWAPWLDRYLVDAVVSDRRTLWEWVSEIGEVAPLRWCWLRGGGAWVPMRYDATRADAVGHIRVGQGRGVERVGTIRAPDEGSLPSELVLDYSPEGTTHAKRARLTTSARARVAASQTPAVEASPLCDAAWSRRTARYGIAAALRTSTWSAAWVYDDATAMQLLRDLACRLCTPPTTCTVAGGRTLAGYGPGDVVTVTDDLEWTDRLALVTETRTDGQRWELELDVLAEPLRRGVRR